MIFLYQKFVIVLIVGNMKGTIQSKVKNAGGGFNESGEPVADTYTWTEPVACLYFANVYNNRGTYQDGMFTQSEYNITTKDLNFTATEILLKDKNGNIVCQKQVQRLEVLDAVKRVKIIV